MKEIFALIVCIAVIGSIFSIGVHVGRHQVHTGVIQCTDLPDERIECWYAADE